jgi:nickel transport protein
MKALLLALTALWCGTAAAHEVHHTVAATGAVVVSLSYADGSAFAYEKYELTPEGQQVPAQVGNTDAAGRVVFLSGNLPRWRLKAYSADGHGVDLRFEAPQPAASTPAAPAAGPDRATQVVIGLSILFGLFGLLQLFLHRRHS